MRTRRNSSNWAFACALCSRSVPVKGGMPFQIIRVGSPAVCISTQVIGLMGPGASRGCGISILWGWGCWSQEAILRFRFECNGFLRDANWHWFYTNSPPPPTSEGGPDNLDNAFARTGRWELVKIRARAPIIVLDLCFPLYRCFLSKHVDIQYYLSRLLHT